MNGLIRWLRGNPARRRARGNDHCASPCVVDRAGVDRRRVSGHVLLGPMVPVAHVPGASLVFALAVVISVWLGRRAASHRQTSGEHVLRAPRERRGRAGLAVVIGTLASRGVLGNDDEFYREDAAFLGAVPTGAFHEDGTQITNLYPYGADGRLLENVRLYDQDGRLFTSVKYDGCMFDSMMGEPKLAARSTSTHGHRARMEVRSRARMHRPGNRSAVWRDLARHLLGRHADAVGQCFAPTKPDVHANRSARFVAEAITRPVGTSPGCRPGDVRAWGGERGHSAESARR